MLQFWRRKGLFTLGNEESPTLYFNRKKSEVSGVVAKTFKKPKSAGYKKRKHRSHDSHARLTEGRIRQVTSSNIKYRVHSAAFTNKGIPKPVRAHHAQSQHQINLVDLIEQGASRAWQEELQVHSLCHGCVHSFSRYFWLLPLSTKSSRYYSKGTEEDI